MRVFCIFEPRDLWIGIFWRRVLLQVRNRWQYRAYVCLLPCLPIVIEWHRRAR